MGILSTIVCAGCAGYIGMKMVQTKPTRSIIFRDENNPNGTPKKRFTVSNAGGSSFIGYDCHLFIRNYDKNGKYDSSESKHLEFYDTSIKPEYIIMQTDGYIDYYDAHGRERECIPG